MEPSKAARTKPLESQHQILVWGGDLRQCRELRRQLQGFSYPSRIAISLPQGLEALASRRIQAFLALDYCAEIAKTTEPRTERKPPAPAALHDETHADWREILRALRKAAGERGVPTLLVCSLWCEAALQAGLEAGTDYVLFAPFEAEDLQRALRDALLNGPIREPGGEAPVIRHDRAHRLRAGEGRLARLAFSLLEQLRQCRAALAWSKAETEDWRNRWREPGEESAPAGLSAQAMAGVAHDLANLLETIRAAATVLQTRPAQPAPYWDAIDAALSQAGLLLTALQEPPGGEQNAGTGEIAELPVVAREVLAAALLAMRAPQVRLQLRMRDVPPAACRRATLSRVLSNLVWNAIEAMPYGGVLRLSGYGKGDRVLLKISDTGTGIAESDQHRIFEPRYSTKAGHAGTGLAEARRLVQSAGGEIQFRSRPGRGSTFVVDLPAAGSPEGRRPPALRTRKPAVK